MLRSYCTLLFEGQQKTNHSSYMSQIKAALIDVWGAPKQAVNKPLTYYHLIKLILAYPTYHISGTSKNLSKIFFLLLALVWSLAITEKEYLALYC